MIEDMQPKTELFGSSPSFSTPDESKKSSGPQTTPKLPRRERLASFSRLVTSENFTDLMPEKVTNRENRNSVKKINWGAEDFPQIRISSSSPKKTAHPEAKLQDFTSLKQSGYSGIQALPFSPNFLYQSPKYTSPMYQQITPMRSPLYVSDSKGVFLGRGSFGNVTLYTYKGKRFALKVTCDRVSVGEKNFVNVRHPHLVSVLHIKTALNKVFICMEFAGHCNLQQVLDIKSELDFRRRLSFTIQIALGLRHCHQRKIVHGDVKPANVIVSPYGMCKLGDFGHSINLNSASKGRLIPHEDMVGTAAYAAPEVLRGAQPNLQSDMYSFGILLWQVQTRELPFAGEHPHIIIYKVATYGIRPAFQENSVSFSEIYERTAECCWKEDPDERLNIFEVLQELKTVEKNLKKISVLN